MPITEITTITQFNEYLNSTSPNLFLLVDFYAQWCGPCKKIAPILHAMSEKYTTITFLKVDVDVVDDLAKKYNISAMPTFMLFKLGESIPITTIVGADSRKIEYAIKIVLGDDKPQDDF